MAIVYLIFFIVGMYGLYKVKCGYKFKGWAIVFVSVAICSMILNSYSEEKNNEPKSQPKQEQQLKKEQTVKWRTDFDDPNATVENTKKCIEVMKKMDNVSANSSKVSPQDIINNPEKYMGKVIEFMVTVNEAENFDANTGAGKQFGSSGHAIVATTKDNMIIMALRKGEVVNKKGDNVVLVGMLAGIMPEGSVNENKAMMIICNPK